ncbi:MAG TPA: ThuA domain-containing protein, partial [Thermomicrobiales bacterium]|nr:ThuA domain-containing protein [Thermomicrobiales bacterium]
MDWKKSTAPLVAGACAAALCAGAFSGVHAQQAPPAAPGQQGAPAGQGAGRGGGRGGVAPALFTAVDVNKDTSLTRDELKTTFDKWYGDWDTARTGALTEEQILAGLTAVFPPPAPPAAGAGGFGGGGGGRGQNQTPQQADVDKMMAALPDKAPAKPAKPRKVLVYARAAGFVHSSIPLAAKTVEAIGTKTGAWATTITYDAADINAANLKQYDAVFLDSTTGAFLDDPNDAAATEARKKALLEFVRGGKGLAGIHAASDSYHRNAPPPAPADAGRAGGGGAGRGRGGFGTGAT